MIQVKTSAQVNAGTDAIWHKLGFYENVISRKPFLLNLILSAPIGSEPFQIERGAESRCHYSDGGLLVKKITNVEVGKSLSFVVTEQTIRFGRVVKLLGGDIVLSTDGNKNQITMITNYQLTSRAYALLRGPVNFVVRSMHKFVIADLCRQLSNESK